MTTQQKKAYDHEYRKLKKHRVIIFTEEQYNFLLNKAKLEGKPFGTYVREMAIAQSKNEYVLPYSRQNEEVKMLLVRYGTNLNQIAHVVNTKQEIFSGQIDEIQHQFLAMKDGIHNIFNAPIQVKELVRTTVIKNPAYRKEIIGVLNEIQL